MVHENGYRWFSKDRVVVWDTHAEQTLQTPPCPELPLQSVDVSEPWVEVSASGIGSLTNQ